MKPHISELKIEAFRGLPETTFADMGQFNLLIGFNNAGKSSILEAIDYFCKPLDPLALLTLSRRRELSAQRHDPIDTVRTLFPKGKVAEDQSFEQLTIAVRATVGDQYCRLETTYESRLVDVYRSPAVNADGSGEPPPPLPPSEANFQKKVADLESLYTCGSSPDELGRFTTGAFTLLEGSQFSMPTAAKVQPIPCVVVSPISHRIESKQTEGISNLVLSRQKQEIIQLLQRFDSQIISVDIISSNGYPEVWINHELNGFMSLSNYGDGIRRVLLIASSVIMAEGGLLLIDELETAIHKDALRDVFTWLRKASDRHHVQIIATTHSLEAIDAMLLAEKDAIDEVVAYRLPRRGSKERFVRYSGEELKDLRVIGGMEVR